MLKEGPSSLGDPATGKLLVCRLVVTHTCIRAALLDAGLLITKTKHKGGHEVGREMGQRCWRRVVVDRHINVCCINLSKTKIKKAISGAKISLGI